MVKQVSKRPQRTPLANRSILGVKGTEPGYSYRIVNDIGDRIAMFEEQGYEIVRDASVTIGDRRVGKASEDGSPVQVSVGDGVQGYLMRIPAEYRAEDEAYKEQKLQELEQSMRKQPTQDYGDIKLKRD